MRNANNVIFRKPEWKRSLGVHKRRQGNIEMEIHELLFINYNLFINNQLEFILK